MHPLSGSAMSQKIILIMLGLLLPMGAASEAFAARSCPNGGYCQSGTCPNKPNKANYACDVKNCSANACAKKPK